MTQLPSITERILSSAEQAARSREQSADRVANPFDQLYFDADGNPTFEQPTAGIIDAIGKNIYLSQEATDSLGTASQAVLRSGAEMISDAFEDQLTAPIAVVGDNLLLNGEQIPLENATARQAWETLPPATQLTMEMSGYTKDSLHAMNINTAADLQDRWTGLVHGTRARQALEQFSENANGLQKTASVVGGFAVDIATDPLLILYLAFTAGTATAARAGAKRASTSVLKDYMKDGVVRSVITRSGLADRRKASRLFFWGSGAAYMGGMNLAYQSQQQVYDIENGLREADESIQYDWAQVGVAGGLGAFFGEIGFRSAGLSPRTHTRETYRAFTEVEDFATHTLSKEERLGFRSKDELVQDIDIETPEFVEEMAKNTLNSQQFNKLVRALADDEEVGEINISKLSSYMLQLPDEAELDAFLAKQVDETHLTTFARLTLDIIDLEPRVREAEAKGLKKEADKLRRALRSAKQERDLHIKNNLNISKDADTPVSAIVSEIANQLPVAANETSSGRIARIMQINDEGIRKASEQLRARTITPAIQRLINKTGGKILNPTQQTRMAMHSEDALERYVSFTHTLIDDTGFDPTEMWVNQKGVRIRSTHERMREMESTKVLGVRTEYERITRGMSAEQVQDFGHTVLKAIDEGTIGSLPTDYQKIARRYQDFTENLGTRGVSVGYLRNKLDNFISLNYNRNAEYAREAFVEQFLRHHRDSFSPDNPQALVNLNTLEAMGYAQRDGGAFVVKGKLFKELPTHISDLPEEILEDYAHRLDESLLSDADAAFSRLTGHHERLSVDPDDPNIRSNRRLRPSPQHSRRMEQSFYLTDEMKNSGLVDYDIMRSVESYNRTTGYNIMRDESLSEFYGQPINFNDWVLATKNMTPQGSPSRAALDRLLTADKIQAGRFRVNEDGAVLAATLQNLASGVVNAGIVPTIVATELAGAVLRNLLHPRELTDYVASIAETAKLMKKNEAKSAQIMFEHETNRFTGDISEFVGQDAKNSRWVQSSATLSRASRIVSGERLFTTAAKAVHFGTSYSKLYYRRGKLDKLRGLSRKFDDIKDLRTAARSAGIDPDDLQRLRSYGLLDDKMLDIAETLQGIDPKALRDRTRLSRATDGLTGDQRAAASELDLRLTRMASSEAEDFVATTTANSKVAVESPILNMLFQFTSFPRAFQNRAVTRASTAPYWKQFTAFNFLLASEITNSVMRDLLYNGHSVETIKESWEDDTEKNLALIISRLPIFGPMNPLPLIASGMAGGQNLGLDNLTGSPALGMASRVLGSAQQTGKALVQGDEIPESAYRTLHRIFPGNNLWYARIIDEGSKGFEEDTDR